MAALCLGDRDLQSLALLHPRLAAGAQKAAERLRGASDRNRLALELAQLLIEPAEWFQRKHWPLMLTSSPRLYGIRRVMGVSSGPWTPTSQLPEIFAPLTGERLLNHLEKISNLLIKRATVGTEWAARIFGRSTHIIGSQLGKALLRVIERSPTDQLWADKTFGKNTPFIERKLSLRLGPAVFWIAWAFIDDQAALEALAAVWPTPLGWALLDIMKHIDLIASVTEPVTSSDRYRLERELRAFG